MFFDLNIPLPTPALKLPSGQSLKKGKQKHQSTVAENSTETSAPLVFSSAQISTIEARIDLLVHLGYTVLALNQIVETKVDSRTHVDWLQGLVPKLKQRRGIAILKRLTVILDEDGEKGNGVNPQNAALLSNYDILSLRPTSQTSFSQSCLTHSVPSSQTTHIISIPVTFPRLPFHLKHTLVRTALRNGVVFEIDYAGAVGIESERRNWWGGARELVRVTKGRGILLSGGASEDKEIRAPRDAANLITLLDIPQNLSHDSITQTPKSVVLRAQSRKTYRTILSEPRLIVPSLEIQPSELLQTEDSQTTVQISNPTSQIASIQPAQSAILTSAESGVTTSSATIKASSSLQQHQHQQRQKEKKRQRDDNQQSGGGSLKKKKK